jgi:hypothetical protein
MPSASFLLYFFMSFIHNQIQILHLIVPIPVLLLQKYICHICVSIWSSNSFGVPLRSFIPCLHFLTELCALSLLQQSPTLLFFPCHLVLYYISLFFYRSLISGGYHCSSPEFTIYTFLHRGLLLSTFIPTP